MSIKITTPLVSIDWLLQHIDHPDLVILDATIQNVNSKNEVLSHDMSIKNARFFDLKNTFSDTTSAIPNMLLDPEAFSKACRALGICSHHRIVVYDQLGIYSSPRVWWMFKTMGHHNIAVLDGGFPEWLQAGFPCQPNKNLKKTTLLGDFKASYQSKMVCAAKTLLQEINQNNSCILDARSKGRYYGIEPEPRKDLKSGHIPSSINLPYKRVLDHHKMLPISEIQKVLKPFDLDNKKLIFTCGSGITACIIMLAAHLAGYTNAVLYDGSWSEWGQLDYVPIES